MAASPDAGQVEAAAHALALLHRQAAGLRAELARLHRDVSQAQQALAESHPVQLLEANEHLVLAALQAQGAADQAMSSLGDLARSSQHDTLTATPNRALVLDRLDQALLVARRRATRVAVLFVDLDNFKAVNDTLGHAAGDDVIRQVARRLESAVRESDTVGRYGGDEFLVVLPAVTQASDAALIAGKMLAAVAAAPCQAGMQELHVSASVGIAVYPEDGEDAATLIDRADGAMYRVKRSGAGGFGFHSTADSGWQPLVVHGDAERLAQVFGNLLDNASKYTPQGGRIALTAVVRGETLAITVSDSGIGISAQALPHLFDLFMQGTQALALHHRGLGIGLAVVRELVEAHGGTVVARSGGHDQGSEFDVTLPLVTLPTSAGDPPAPSH